MQRYAIIPPEWSAQSWNPVKNIITNKKFSQKQKLARLTDIMTKAISDSKLLKGKPAARAAALGLLSQASNAMKDLKSSSEVEPYLLIPKGGSVTMRKLIGKLKGQGIGRVQRGRKLARKLVRKKNSLMMGGVRGVNKLGRKKIPLSVAIGGGILGHQVLKRRSNQYAVRREELIARYGIGAWLAHRVTGAKTRAGNNLKFKKGALSRTVTANAAQGAIAMLGMYVVANLLNRIPEVRSDVEFTPQYALENPIAYTRKLIPYIAYLDDAELYATKSFGEKLYKGSRNSSLAWLVGFMSAEVLGRGLSKMPAVSRQEIVQQNTLQENVINYIRGMEIGRTRKPTKPWGPGAKITRRYPGGRALGGAVRKRGLMSRGWRGVKGITKGVGKFAGPAMTGLIGASIISDLMPKKRPVPMAQQQYALGMSKVKPFLSGLKAAHLARKEAKLSAWILKAHKNPKIKKLILKQHAAADLGKNVEVTARQMQEGLMRTIGQQQMNASKLKKLAAFGIPVAALTGAAGSYPIVKGQVKKRVIKAVDEYALRRLHYTKGRRYDEAITWATKMATKAKKAERQRKIAVGVGASGTAIGTGMGFLAGHQKANRQNVKPKVQYAFPRGNLNWRKLNKHLLKRSVKYGGITPSMLRYCRLEKPQYYKGD